MQESEELFRLVLDNLTDLVAIIGADGRRIYNSPSYRAVLGEPSALQGTDSFREIHPEDAPRVRRVFEETVATGRGQRLEYRFVLRNGEVRYMESVGSVIRDAAGKVDRVVVVARDVTERKRLDEAVQESQERLELVIRGSNDGVWDWDVRTNAVYFSPRWKEMLGYAEWELPNRFEEWERLIHPEDRERALRTVADYFEGRTRVYELEHRLRHRDGSYRWILARGVVLRDADGRPIRMAGSHVDLTDRKRAEEQLRTTNEELARRGEELRRRVAELDAANQALREAQLQLIQAAKMEVVGTLAAGVAHEVRNPLQTLLMGLDFLEARNGPDDSTGCGVLRDMRQAVQRADYIVRGLLEFSATNQPARSHQDLNALIRQALHLAAFALNRSQVRVQEDLDARMPPVLVDANKLEQALLNLVVNAVHAMPEGGTLTVRSRYHPAADAANTAITPSPSRRTGAAPAEAVIEIEDTGTGIPPALMSRVFDPFFTTKPHGAGTGLGLPITKRIVELHGGQIQVQNRAEGGVRVTIRLPCLEDRLAAGCPPA